MEVQYFKKQRALTMSTILTLITIIALPGLSRASIFQHDKTTVLFDNELYEAEFKIHCWSGDDDLGTHTVKYGGDYKFSFRPAFFGNTIFTCMVSNRDLGTASVVAYKENRDLNDRCRTLCVWGVNKEGVSGYPQIDYGDRVKDIWIKWDK